MEFHQDMQLALANGKPVRGDIIKSSVIRYDLSPVPATLEAEIRVDNELRKQLGEGKVINADGDNFRIVKPVGITGRESQGQHDMSVLHITALLDSCHQIAFVRQRAIIKEKTLLTEIYRAAGATIPAVAGDFHAGRFTCMNGETPSFHIARLLQDEGGVVRWKSGKLQFFRLGDLFKQKPVLELPNNESENIVSGFLERHEIPSFYSIAPDGSIIYGNKLKARSAKFAPGKNLQQLQNMSRCLVQRKVSKINYNPSLRAGDLINFLGFEPLAIVTVAHVYQSGNEGSGSNQYSKLWLSGIGT